ncbi:Rv1733c family protein [Streptomyces sp. GS7]|uniref:Rv1733c family protein n=1 Tax=Streptomyces sp. GS7 TaxID=2692234 RepID=UPI003FA7E5A3
MRLPACLPPWRHNPLRRRADVIRSLLLPATGVLIAVAAPAAGWTAADAVATAAAHQVATRHGVPAVLVEDPPVRIGTSPAEGAGVPVHTTVRWTLPDGTTRTGETAVPPALHAGDRTTAWLDGHGALLRDPVTPGDAVAGSIAAGTAAGCGTALLLAGAERCGAALLDRRCLDRWEREWAAVDGHLGHPSP